MTPGRLASSPSSASAGGHDEHPCEVNSSTTTGRVSAEAAPAKIARASARSNFIVIRGPALKSCRVRPYIAVAGEHASQARALAERTVDPVHSVDRLVTLIRN